MMVSGRRPMTRAAWTYSLLFSTMRRAAHRARVLHPAGEADGEDQHRDGELIVPVARQGDARDAVDQERDQDRREGKLHVGDAHDDRVDAPAEVTGEESKRHAEHQRKQHRRQARRRARCGRRA